MFFKRFLSFSVCLILLPACSHAPQRAFERVAFVQFEDLSSDGKLGWIASAVSGIAVSETQGDARVRTFETRTVRDAQDLKATRIISGYLTEKSGTPVLHASIRDEDSRKLVRSLEFSAPAQDVLRIATELASSTGAPVSPWPAVQASALRDYFSARQASTPAEALSLLNQAVSADPAFGPAQVQRAETLASSGDKEQTLQAIEAARRARLSPADQARLDLVSSLVAGNPAGQVAAATRLAALDGVHSQLWRSVAEAQLTLKNHRAAADAAAHVLELEPRDEAMLNVRGYALGLAGDIAGARESFDQYARTYPNSANPLDSLGEVLFYNRYYEEAGKLFLQADAKQPGTLAVAEPFRAAVCRFLLNDTSGADALFAQYIGGLRRNKDPLITLRQAIWQRMTRRNPSAPADSAGQAMAALWAVQDGDRDGARALADAARKTAKAPAEINLASTALLLSQPSAPEAVWQSRLTQALPDPRQADVRSQLLGWALLLDRRFGAAAVVWRPLWERNSALTGNDFRILLTWSLTEAGQLDEARKVMPQGWMPPRAPEPGLQALLYPVIADVRSKL